MSPLLLGVQQSQLSWKVAVSQTFTRIQPLVVVTFSVQMQSGTLLFAISTAWCFPSNEMNNDEELWNLTIMYWSWHIKLKSI